MFVYFPSGLGFVTTRHGRFIAIPSVMWSATLANPAALPMRNSRTLFGAHRQRFNRLSAKGRGDTAEAAALFYYLNRTGFNGLCRFNRSGQFNVPFGRYKRIAYTRDFGPYCRILAGWEFVNQDFALPLS